MLACAALLFASPQAAAAAVDANAPAHVFLETVTARSAFYVHEPIAVRLRLGVDTQFFATNALQMFHRQLDLPVRLEAVWLAAPDLPDLPDLLEGDRAERRSIALNDAVVRARRAADEVRDGRTFTVVELDHRFLPEEAGTFTVPESALRYAYATRFEDDLLRGRVALDRVDGSVQCEPLSLRIDPWPEEGRPEGFTGAVGSFELQLEWKSGSAPTSSFAPPEVRVGEPFQVTLRIEGEGSLERIEVPRLGEHDGFHLFGLLETKGPRRRTVTMELSALRDDVREIPPLAIDYFDPAPPPGWRIARSQPLPLRVLPSVAAESPRSASKETAFKSSAPRRFVAMTIALLALLGLCGAIAWCARERRLTENAGVPDPSGRFRARVTETTADVALAEYLAARLHCPTAAVIAPDLTKRLVIAGIEPGLAQRAAQVLEALVADRYRGPDASGASEADRATKGASLPALIAELEHAFRAAR